MQSVPMGPPELREIHFDVSIIDTAAGPCRIISEALGGRLAVLDSASTDPATGLKLPILVALPALDYLKLSVKANRRPDRTTLRKLLAFILMGGGIVFWTCVAIGLAVRP